MTEKITEIILNRFRKEILRLNPTRFEIGPVYSTNPRDRKNRPGTKMNPVAKELVFDIDMTDYDDVRTCCSKANICHKCWSFITMAIKVVDTALREDFGFEHILWVYSGRRGAHAWVGDHRARNLPDDRRKAIAGYLELVKGNDKSGKRVNVKRPLHPHVARCQTLGATFQPDDTHRPGRLSRRTTSRTSAWIAARQETKRCPSKEMGLNTRPLKYKQMERYRYPSQDYQWYRC